MMIRNSLLILLVSFTTVAFGQSKKKKQAEPVPTLQQPSSLSPNTPQQAQQSTKTKSKTKNPKLEVRYDAERQYYKRAKQVAKDQIKAEKEMQKPQYSDPMYFGHKKPPKKRPAGKTKYCKECGLKH
jgi:uncharacterized protein HemX